MKTNNQNFDQFEKETEEEFDDELFDDEKNKKPKGKKIKKMRYFYDR